LPSEKLVRQQQLQYEYEFEADSVTINNELITYVRVRDPVTLIQRQLQCLRLKNQLCTHKGVIPDNEIWLHMLGDKGGYSTKLMVSIINTHKPLSRNQILLALYEGASEDYDVVSYVFKQIYEKLYSWAHTNNNSSSNEAQTIRIFQGGDMMWLWMLHGFHNVAVIFAFIVYQMSEQNQRN
jgi:spore coat protein CotF